MWWLVWLVAPLLTLLLLASHLVPWLLSSLLSLYLGKAKVRLGAFGLRRLEVFHLSLEMAALEVRVENLRLTSSVLTSDASNLITLVATGVTVVVADTGSLGGSGEGRGAGVARGKSSARLLLLAQFLGLQVHRARLELGQLPAVPDCRLVTEVSELRLDSSVIHRTKLSLALCLFPGSVKLLRDSPKPLLEATWGPRMEASVQATATHGTITAVNEVNLDVYGLEVHLLSSLFQHLQPPRRPAAQPSEGQGEVTALTALIPKVAQVKMEGVSGRLEHTDGVSCLAGELGLFYLCSTCTEPAKPCAVPDGHINWQLGGLRVWPAGRAGEAQSEVASLSRFHLFVEKREERKLESTTTIHGLTGCYSAAVDAWLAPVSWLVRTAEQRKAATGLVEQEAASSWVARLQHKHQVDAHDSDLVVLEGEQGGAPRRWRVALHSLSLALAPAVAGMATSREVVARQARWSMDAVEVLAVSQVDARVRGTEEMRQVDVMVTGTSASYTPELLELAARVREVVRPIMLQVAPTTRASRPSTTSLAFVVSQTRVVWGYTVGGQRVGVVGELREGEGSWEGARGKLALSGVKVVQQCGGEETLACLSLPQVALARKEGDVRLTVSQRVRVAWQPSLHLTLLRLVQDWGEARALLLPTIPASPTTRAAAPVTFHLVVSDKVTALLHTGQHTVKVLLSSLKAKLAPPSAVSWLQAPRVRVKLDRLEEGRRSFHEVVAVEEAVLSLVPKCDRVSAERRRMEGATVSENACLVVAVASLAIIEPYQFPLHKVFFGEVMGAVKWVKELHRKATVQGEAEPLPRDMLINLKSFRLELTDDPFEVKLRDNYELKEDEYLESEKRMKVLQQRVEEMKRKNFMFPKEKIDELLAKMEVKNADIYVQRAKKFCEPRTRLMEWVVAGLEVMVVADPSTQGRARVLHHLRECDRESPWPPDSSLSFNTLWCRWVRLEADSLSVHLRDFPQKLLDVRGLALWGRLAGAEAAPGKRATRTHTVAVGEPWGPATVERSLMPLKFYHDLACDVEALSFAYGSCWEPAMTQCSIAMAYLTGGASDPSPPLPWWDKARLLLHGRLLLVARSTQLLLHASLDPYNTTEEMCVSWTDMELEWTEAQWRVRGTLDVYVRTASKYDDGHLLHLPALSLLVKLEWASLANPLDHHSVAPCAPDKLPEYRHNQEHDSYRAFRSNHLNLSAQMETRGSRGTRGERPKLDMFSSTLRWFENLKFIFSGASRPIRRGSVNMGGFTFLGRPKKPHFSRHLKRVGFSVSLHQFQVNYWTSFSQRAGILLNVARGINLSTEHILNLVPFKDGLHRRPRADWGVSFINGELTTSDLWIQSAVERESPPASPTGEEASTASRDTIASREATRNTEKSFFFCVEKVVYMRMGGGGHLEGEGARPVHQLVVHGARVAWTQENRDMWYMLYESWRRAQILRKNVSSDALKHVQHVEVGGKREAGSGGEGGASSSPSFASPPPHHNPQTSSPFGYVGPGRGGGGVSMLDRLLQGAEGGAPTVPCEDMEAEEEMKQRLEAKEACTQEDILHRHASIELVNSQVLLKGIETSGYVIISAARAVVRQNMHRPVWKEKTLLSKTTWSGGLETMQYYATVHEEGSRDLDNIMWLTVDNIGEGEESQGGRLAGPAGLVGSGRAVGGVVSQVVGDHQPGDQGIQLQRIVSRCKAEFFYVSYGDTELEAVEGGAKMAATTTPADSWAETETAVNAFSFVHHDLNASTNSLQYAMLLDIVNNLVLHTEPAMKERTDRCWC